MVTLRASGESLFNKWTLCCDDQGDEEAPLAHARGGNVDVFAELIRRYRDRIFNLAWQLLGDRDDAEDVAQETFLRAFEHWHEFRGDAQVFTWLYRIAINACKMRLRQRRFVELLPDDHEPADEINWRDVEERWLLKRRIDAVLSRLPEPLRLVLLLRELHDLRYDEIAKVLNIPVGTVRSRLFEARKRFAQIWGEMFGDVKRNAQKALKGKVTKMQCEKAQRWMSLWLDDMLEEAERQVLLMHLQSCERCQQVWRDWEQMRAAFRAYPSIEPSPDFERRLLVRLKMSKPSVPPVPSHWLMHPVLRIASSALGGLVVAALTLLLLLPFTPSSSPSPPASLLHWRQWQQYADWILFPEERGRMRWQESSPSQSLQQPFPCWRS